MLASTSKSKYRRFINASAKRGPHLIPRKRQMSNEFHRIFSIKAGMRIVCTESPLEADAVIYAEGNSDITELCEQPLRILEPIGTQPYITLDLSVVHKDGSEIFYEIKSEDRLKVTSDGRRVPAYWEEVEAWFKEHSMLCDVLTNLDLEPHRQFIANWRRLLPFARIAYENTDPYLEDELLSICKQFRETSFSELFNSVPRESNQTVTAIVAKLLHKGLVDANLDKSVLSPQTKIRCVNDA